MLARTLNMIPLGEEETWFLSVSPQSCFSAEQLLRIHQLADPAHLGRSGLAQLSPALLQQILSGACAQTTEASSADKLTQTESK